MIRLFCYGDVARVRRILLTLVFLFCFAAAALAADSITGTARNQSQGRAAAGDDVILLVLDQGMREAGRTKTDDQGGFTLKIPEPGKPYVVRVVHQGVNYDQSLSAGTAVNINVFDAAAKVQGVSGNIEIIRTGTKDNALHVSDMIDIKNESQPPVTQAGERTLDVYLPPKAKIASVLASGAGKLAVFISATPVPGESGHYTVNFPLRPGSTQFAFNYDLPYEGRAVFHPRLAYPVRQLAVMIPPTMKFSSSSPAFQPLNIGNVDYKVQAASQLQAGEAPAFEISGAGAMPSIQARAQPRAGTPNTGSPAVQPALPSTNSSVPQTQAPVQTNPGSAAPAPVTPAAPASRRERWILAGAAVLVLGICGVVIWRTRRQSSPAVAAKAQPTGAATTSLLEALKQELLDLETSRLQGSISQEEYEKAKQALDGTVQRALARAAAKS